ncbi:HlyD family secretion protein [Bacillus pseudomycoides]|uniref:HlyD family efflux transporter periplasmic adaptor subunit n=1 Tax=Bacillus pseudomycoides TaxID=64104 RepID=A0AAJ2DJ52_9BACI|nr:HlyD family efflux transporter periplasmic adaptor subunit [Bacillus pseudomycoides]MDR4325345.1 HlyD family efflux transporter periplasmic adaptor subunit [Bacillus pseudomycoides]MED1534613.1 HlyD family efflux transporter periplasmic adaptor subunit [Bacillus pseudomycoides]PFZ88119.1 multidrug efflux protein [Bacillus pseudomycoides]PHD19992.1 multidrug efflux protein [Bacillus pseudomycoides]
MNQFRRMVIINIITLIVLVGGGIGGYYYYNQAENYLKTDNAKIDGKVIPIVSPVAGKLAEWRAEVGKSYNENDKLGAVTVSGQNGEQTIDVTIPKNATVVQSNATTNAFVGAGSPIAYAYDMNDLWVTANIEETDIDSVQKGQEVDVYVDAYPDTTLTGKVEQVGLTTANTFSMLPSSNATANYTKVTQVVPVKVSLDHSKSVNIVPGMNVTVRIHK